LLQRVSAGDEWSQLLSGNQLDHLNQLLPRVAACPHQTHFHALHEALVQVECLANVDIRHHHYHPTRPGAFYRWLDVFGMRAEGRHGIHPLTAGDAAHFLAKISASGVDDILGAILLRHIQLGLHRIDSDNLRSADASTLDGVQAQDATMLQITGVLARVPVVPKQFQTCQADEIYLELAERIGFLYGEGGLNDHLNLFWKLTGEHKLELDRRYTTAEILDRALKSKFGIENGIDYFQHASIYYKMRSKAESYNSFYYPEGTTRYAFYFEHLLKTGDTLRQNLSEHNLTIPGQDMVKVWRFYQPIPEWVGRPDASASAEYDLFAMNWSTPQFRMHNSDQTGNPLLNELVDETDPYQFVILMNRETAARKGLQDGDLVRVVAYWGGCTEGVLRVTSLLHPDALGVPGNHGFKSSYRNPATSKGPHFNSLLNSAEGTFDPLHGGIDRNPRVRVYQVGGNRS
jgi:hypothetical protein